MLDMESVHTAQLHPEPSIFDSNLAAWKRNESTPWGRLRRSIALHNLARHLPPPGADILDVGGGNARDSIPLAKMGHRVTVVDYSSQMLADANVTATQEEIPGDLLKLVEADAGTIPDLFEAASHDVVLLHNVLSYVEDAGSALEAATHSLKPSGILSLIQVNRYSEAVNAALRDRDLDAAMSRLDAKRSTARQFANVPVRRFAFEELSGLLATRGFEVIGHYGILCITGYIADDEIKYDPGFFAKLERLEAAMSARHPYNLMAKFCHLIATRASGPRSAAAMEQ